MREFRYLDSIKRKIFLGETIRIPVDQLVDNPNQPIKGVITDIGNYYFTIIEKNKRFRDFDISFRPAITRMVLIEKKYKQNTEQNRPLYGPK